VTGQYRAGSVYLLDIDFEQGRGDETKFLVLLGDCPESNAKSIFAFATSQGRHYPAIGDSPCEPKGRCYRIDPGQEKCFSKTTFVQFHNAYPITRAGLDDAIRTRRPDSFTHSTRVGFDPS
jgi:hypothetical protein